MNARIERLDVYQLVTCFRYRVYIKSWVQKIYIFSHESDRLRWIRNLTKFAQILLTCSDIRFGGISAYLWIAESLETPKEKWKFSNFAQQVFVAPWNYFPPRSWKLKNWINIGNIKYKRDTDPHMKSLWAAPRSEIEGRNNRSDSCYIRESPSIVSVFFSVFISRALYSQRRLRSPSSPTASKTASVSVVTREHSPTRKESRTKTQW